MTGTMFGCLTLQDYVHHQCQILHHLHIVTSLIDILHIQVKKHLSQSVHEELITSDIRTQLLVVFFQ